MVAALYVDRRGPYFDHPAVDPWDEKRDARQYAGPHRVIAHPPCSRWCQLAHLVQAMHGYAIGDDDGCFEAALRAVRNFGGVLEHPAYSLAWPAFDLPRPVRGYWQQSLFDPGWVTEVSQSAYGHPARKRTWLYYVGPDPKALDWSEPRGSITVSDFGPGNTRRRGDEWEPGIQYAAASGTPARFMDELLALATS